jgi:hypothetical protein
VLPNGDVLRIEVSRIDVSSETKIKYVPGLTEYFLNDQPISPEEYERLLETASR